MAECDSQRTAPRRLMQRLLRIGFYGSAGLILVFVLVDPYSRQSIFGPKVGGEPLCYWQAAFRKARAPNATEPILLRALTLIGIKPLERDRWPHDRKDQLLVLLSLIDDPNTAIRVAVAPELGWHSESAEAREALIRLFDDPESDVRAAAAYGGYLRDAQSAQGWPEAALARLRSLLDDENERCRVCAAAIVCKASRPCDQKTNAILLESLRSSSPDVRIIGVHSLCDAGKDLPNSLRDLADAAHQDRNVRAALSFNASKFGALAVPLLTEYLQDGDQNVRHGAAIGLAALGPAAKAAVPALMHALADPNANVRARAREALSEIDPGQFPKE